MHSSSPIRSALLLPLLVAASLAGCRQAADPSEANAVENAVTNTPAEPRQDAALDRGALLAAVARAASASAAGTEAAADLRSLDGRQFEVRIRFGCGGPSAESAENWLTWSFDAETRTIRIRARPTISGQDPLVAGIGAKDFEAAEGFWIPRPWLLEPVCPAGAAVQVSPQPMDAPVGNAIAPDKHAQAAAPETRGETLPSRQRVGIAQFFTATDSRTRRRDDRPYQAVHTLKEGQAIGSQGFNLVLTGRLRAVPGRGVIECSATGPDSPPDCIVAAEFQRVWIEMPDSREVIAEWGGG